MYTFAKIALAPIEVYEKTPVFSRFEEVVLNYKVFNSSTVFTIIY